MYRGGGGEFPTKTLGTVFVNKLKDVSSFLNFRNYNNCNFVIIIRTKGRNCASCELKKFISLTSRCTPDAWLTGRDRS